MGAAYARVHVHAQLLWPWARGHKCVRAQWVANYVLHNRRTQNEVRHYMKAMLMRMSKEGGEAAAAVGQGAAAAQAVGDDLDALDDDDDE